jgi:magnesium and cobalt transporter
VIVSEIINEALIIRFDMALLKMTMPLIKILRYSIFFPFIFCIETLRYKIDKWQLQNDDEEERTTTEDEILSLVEQNETDGEDSSLEEDEKRMIKGVFDLDNTDVREIMTPRVDIIGINMNDSVDDALKLFIESGHSRIPVYENNMDNITGILYAKDFLNKNKVENKKLDRIARRPIFIPETKEVGDLLAEMQKARNHFSVVIDEYGGTAGIVTLEDIIEEIVGEIRDEYDVNEDDTPMHIAMSDGSVVFDARTLIDDVNDILDSHLPENEDVDTIGGFICGELGHIPRKGENLIIEDGSLKITVLQADRKKILKIKISRI